MVDIQYFAFELYAARFVDFAYEAHKSVLASDRLFGLKRKPSKGVSVVRYGCAAFVEVAEHVDDLPAGECERRSDFYAVFPFGAFV